MTTTSILIYIILGSLGLGYLMFGKKERKAVAFFSGIGLTVMPYFTMNLWLVVPATIVFVVLPFFFNI